MKRKIRTADIQIDIVDFLLEFVRKAWLIVACAVVCAAVLAVAGNGGSIGYTSIKTELTEEDKALLAEYETLLAQKEEKETYLEESVVMNLDTKQISATTMLYFIGSENNDNAIASCYKNYIESQRLADYITAKDADMIGQDIRDLVIVKNLNSGNVLEISIRGNDKAYCDKVEAYVKEAFDAYKTELTGIFGEHKLNLVGTSNSTYSDSAFIQKQDGYKKEYTDLTTSVTNMKTSLIEARLIENDGTVNAEEGRSIMYFLVIGAVIGAVIAVVIIVMIYVMTDTIKTVDDLGNVVGLYCFGNVAVKKKEEADKQVDIISKKVYTTCTNTNTKELLLVANVDNNTRPVVEVCVEKLAAMGVKARLIENLNNSEDVVAIKKDMPVVFVESLRKTKYSSAIKDVEYCNLQGADIWGYITVLY